MEQYNDNKYEDNNLNHSFESFKSVDDSSDIQKYKSEDSDKLPFVD